MKLIKIRNAIIVSIIYGLVILSIDKGLAQSPLQTELDNPITPEYLNQQLSKTYPRLVLTPQLLNTLRLKIKNDPVIANVYKAIRLNSKQILSQPLLERKLIGRRLLHTSRNFLYRMNILGMMYLIEKDPHILERINNEVIAVCNFSDWNPSHFLDVGEMAMGVSIALDWTLGDLPESTKKLAKQALIQKAIEPSYISLYNKNWIKSHNNWNQVCHAGLIASALSIASDNPELAARTIKRSLESIPYALNAYRPDGVYPEGSSYWSYGTSFTVLTASMLRTAFGTDFGIGEYPAFLESAMFRVLSVAPSGHYYNFFDCGDKRSRNGDFVLAWFAAETGISLYFERDRFLVDPASMGKLSRVAGAGLVWLSQFTPSGSASVPRVWKGEGINPIAIFRSNSTDTVQFYLGTKGGMAVANHGNMDAGSFIYELNGVRWAIDPGNQSYHPLEETGFGLWSKCQECDRWKLLTKNNFGHSTLTVNNALHHAVGKAEIISFNENSPASVTYDLTPVFEGQLTRAHRTFTLDNPDNVLIQDDFEITDSTKTITWQIITTANVTVTPYGALLSQKNEQLKIENLSHPGFTFSVISLDPPPFKLDKTIAGLKRVELVIPAWTIRDKKETIKIRLTGKE